MRRYNPGYRQGGGRDESNPAEIAGHRPALVTRIVTELDYEETDPRHSLRGQPDELYEDESYHHDMNAEKFNRELRGGQSIERLRRG